MGAMISDRRIIFVLLFGIILGVAATSFYFSLKLAELEQNPQARAQDMAEELVEKISTLMVLPKGEVPTIATVSDPQLLGEQPFFSDAKEGFKVLMYPKAQKAILYDPVNHEIIVQAPLNTTGEFLVLPPGK